MKTGRALLIYTILTFSISGCDPTWGRESVVEVSSQGFPACVSEAMRSLNLQPYEFKDPDGSERLVAAYLFGALNVTATTTGASTKRKVVKLRLIGRGFKPPSQIEPKLDEGMATVTSAIAKHCSND